MRKPILLLILALFLAVPALANNYTQVTLKYNGDVEDAHVTVEVTVTGGANQYAFDGTVQPGETFVVDPVQEDLGPTLRIRVNGKHNTTIRTNCSVELVPGYTRKDFEVVDAVGDCGGDDGGDECEDDGEDDGEGDDGEGDDGEGDDGEGDDGEGDDGEGDDGEGDEECGECDGQVTELSLLYNGTGEDDEEEVHVIITQFVKNDHRYEVFRDFVAPGDVITFEGANHKGTFGPRIRVVVDGHLQVRLDTSCETDIGQGTLVGDFEIVEGYSRNGGLLCIKEDEDGEPACDACDGQVSSMVLRYNGDETANVEVDQKVRGTWETIFDEDVDPDGLFSIFGISKQETFGAKIRLFVDGEENGTFDTSCETEIGPGTTEGDFEVVDGYSRNGGRLCEDDGEEDDEEDDGGDACEEDDEEEDDGEEDD